MSKIELITEKEFKDFLEMQDKINKLIEAKTIALSLIMYGKTPDGEISDFDIYESEFEKGCIDVWYDTSTRCGQDNDLYKLPFEFLWDETYPQKYKKDFEEKKRLLQEIENQSKKERLERNKIGLEIFERETYERLKKKYESDINMKMV